MAGGEILELVPDDADGVVYAGTHLFVLELQEQAFAKVPGADAGRLELLDDPEHLLDLLGSRFDPGAEGEVVRQGLEVAAEIAFLVQRTDDEGADGPLVLRQVAEAELLHEGLREALLDGEGIVLGALIFAPVVDIEIVGRDVVGIVGVGILGAGSTGIWISLTVRICCGESFCCCLSSSPCPMAIASVGFADKD